MPRAFDDLKDGTVLEPFHLNMIYRELRRWRKAKAVPPMVLNAADSADSPPIFQQGSITSGFLCIANGNIPARSGSTAGVGSVYSVTTTPTYSGGSLTAASLSTDSTAYDVINASSNNMTDSHGIDSGQYCWAEYGTDGLLYVTPLECS